jgi:hypothetical protein
MHHTHTTFLDVSTMSALSSESAETPSRVVRLSAFLMGPSRHTPADKRRQTA